MIIDTHNHVYPDKVAAIIARNMASLGELHTPEPFKVSDLLATMDKDGIDRAVIFCIGEKPTVVKAANDFVISAQRANERLIAMGTIHPDTPDYKEELVRLKANGVNGIKYHCVFQGGCADEDRMMRVWSEMAALDMVLYLHAGSQLSSGTPPGANPKRVARILDAFPKLKVVAAHFGGLEMLDESQQYLIGRDVYLDTSWTPSVETLDPKVITRLIERHGSHRVMFATDYPFTHARKQADWLAHLPLRAGDKENIFAGNAMRLFGITP